MKNLKTLCLLLILPAFLSAQNTIEKWTAEYDQLLKSYVTDGKVDYEGIKGDAQLGALVAQVADLKPVKEKSNDAKAFYINAYNLLVISSAADNYPLGSVQQVSGFFDRNKVRVAGKKYTLNGFEKDFIFKKYSDPRLHFVLVCGALGCPPITDFAYQADNLENQLDVQTTAAINDPNFIRVSGSKASLSKIFQWYNNDFGGGKKDVLNYINRFRTNAIPTSSSIAYYDYDWSINDTKNTGSSLTTGGGGESANAFRYVTSATIPKGQIELKVFNNLFSQQIANSEAETDLLQRSTFNTTSISALYGLTPRFNLGFNLNYRRTFNSGTDRNALAVFKSLDDLSGSDSGRSGITGIGPRIRWAPIPEWSGFSLQSTLTFATGSNLEGIADKPFIEWDSATFWTQFFYDKSIGTRFSFFAELDVLWEDIGSFDKISLPATVIFSYFPDKKVTIYSLAGYAPAFTPDFDYFHQLGLGTKLQVTRKFEIELLYTSFRTKFVKSRNGVANTFNLGLRFTI